MMSWVIGFKVSLYMIFGQSYLFNLLLLISSFVFSFCLWHRILIFSMTTVLVLENLQFIGLKIDYYSYTCILIVVFSTVLSSILYYKNGCYREKNHSKAI